MDSHMMWLWDTNEAEEKVLQYSYIMCENLKTTKKHVPKNVCIWNEKGKMYKWQYTKREDNKWVCSQEVSC